MPRPTGSLPCYIRPGGNRSDVIDDTYQGILVRVADDILEEYRLRSLRVRARELEKSSAYGRRLASRSPEDRVKLLLGNAQRGRSIRGMNLTRTCEENRERINCTSFSEGPCVAGRNSSMVPQRT